MTDHELPDGQQRFLADVERMSYKTKDEQSAWLLYLQNTLKDHPNSARIIHLAKQSMEVLKNERESKTIATALRERIEAEAMNNLEFLIALPLANFDDSLSVAEVAKTAILSLLLEPLRVRCQEPDAQEKLSLVYSWTLKQSKETL